MRRRYPKTSISLMIICIFLSFVAHGWCGHVYVLKVLDGDSIRVKKGNRIFEIRLYGIDAPEHGQSYGDQAKYFTKALLHKKTISVDERDTDRYGRLVAVVRFQGRVVNRELVKRGLAWVYPRYCKEKELCSLLEKDQEKARAARRGLWKDDTPMPPWQWKRAVEKGDSTLRFHRKYHLPNGW